MLSISIQMKRSKPSLLKEMDKRLSDLRPISEKIHRSLIDAHRRDYAIEPVGPMVRLGPSIINPGHPQHIFEAAADSVTFGSSVRYAGYYSEWREQNEGAPLVRWTPQRLDDIAKILLKWAVHGR